MENNIVEDWYSIENILTKKVEKYIDEKLNQMETKLISHIDQQFKTLHHTLEKRDIDHKKIQELLYELKNYKEREINLMIREKIPFPFGLPPKSKSPLHQSFMRLPFSDKKL